MERERTAGEAQDYELLVKLLPDEFNLVVFKAGAPKEHFPAPTAPQAARAIALLEWARQSDENRTQLREALVFSRPDRKPAVTSTAARGVERLLDQGALDTGELPALQFDGLDSGSSSRIPIVIAIEQREHPLDENDLLKTERHLTLTLGARDLQLLDEIDASVATRPPLATIAQHGRAAWKTFAAAQPRLRKVIEKLVGAGADQPIAWTGRTDLLLRLHRTIQILRPGSGTDIGGFLTVACGAHYFWPLEASKGEWTVQPRSPSLRVGVLNPQGESRAGSLAEAGIFDVVVLLADDLTSTLRSLTGVVAKGFTRVAVGLGTAEVTPQLLCDLLSRVPCVSIGGPALRQEDLANMLRAGFGTRAVRYAAPCVLSAVRKAWLELDSVTANAVLDAILWSTWSWIGRPLFAQEFGELPPAAVPHLMDLRSVAAKGWYFNRSEGIPKPYKADKLSAPDTPPAERVHLYVSGAGGTGKSCFLRYVYEQLLDRSDVIPVWYRIDAPSSSWDDVERRLREEIVAAATRPDKMGDAGKQLLPPGGKLRNALREAAKKMRAPDDERFEIVIFIDQLERTFESGDEPDQKRLSDISEEITKLLETVKVGEGVRVFIASRKQYLPDFLRSSEAVAVSGLHFNVLQAISEATERATFVETVLVWCKSQNLLEESIDLDAGVAETIARKVHGHPLNMMLALIQLLSEEWHENITEEALERTRPWERLFHLDLRAVAKDDIDWNFVLAMAHARTEIVRFEEVWWRLRLVDPTLTRRVDELRPRGVLERLWLVGHLGRTIHPRPYKRDPARFLEFFHANLRDYLLTEVMGQGGAPLGLLGRRCETPAAWRALERLSAAAHEWEQVQQQLPYEDVRVLMEHRDVVVEKVKWSSEPEHEPFYLLFLRDESAARAGFCRAARECFAFSAIVHDELGRWAVETLFPDVDKRVECCERWLRRCHVESRAPILRYLIQLKATTARTSITSIVLPDAEPLADGLPVDLAQVLTEPLHAVRFRHEVVAAVLEKAVTRSPMPRASVDALPDAVREFIALACAGNRNDLVNVLAHCAKRFEGSQDERLRKFGGALASHVVADEWVTDAMPAAILRGDADPRDRQGRLPPPVELVLGSNLLRAVDQNRAASWLAAVRERLGVPLPPFDVAAGEVEPDELELRLRGDRVALGRFHADRSQVLKRHWERTQPATPPDAYDTQNDALDEVVLWLNKDLLTEIGWELPAQDFDKAAIDWLETMLRRAISSVLDIDLTIEFINTLATVLNTTRLFPGVTLNLLRQVLVDLVEEHVPLADGGVKILEQLHLLARRAKDGEILTQKLREHVKDDLCRAFADEAGQMPTLMLDEAYENALSRQVAASGDGPVLRLDPAAALALASAIRRQFERNLRDDVRPVIVCVAPLRLALSRLLRRFDPRIFVLSFTELSQEVIPVPAGLVEAPRAVTV